MNSGIRCVGALMSIASAVTLYYVVHVYHMVSGPDFFGVPLLQVLGVILLAVGVGRITVGVLDGTTPLHTYLERRSEM